MANIAGTYDPNAEVSQFDRLPAFADQRARIIASEIIPISDKENKGRCLNLTWQVETGPLDGRLFWQRLNMWPENMDNIDKVISIANSQFAAIRQATGKPAPQDSSELHQIPCLVSYGPQKKNPDYDEVKSVKPAGGAPQAISSPARFNPPPQQSTSASGGGRPWPSRQSA
jgi:hypothetical protein